MIRIIAAGWCLGSFFIFELYHATMISSITSYRPERLINSPQELIQRPDVHLIADQGLDIEVILKVLFHY